MPSLLDIPLELTELIIAFFIHNHNPLPLLCTSKAIYKLSLPLLHSSLYLRSQKSLELFICDDTRARRCSRVPTTITLELLGVPRRGLSEALGKVFERCTPAVENPETLLVDDEGRLLFDRLSLRCHTRRDDPVQHLEDVLRSVKYVSRISPYGMRRKI